MTDLDSTLPEPLAELVTGVHTLTAAVTESHANMEKLAASNEQLNISSKRHRRWIAVTIIGLVIDLALSLLFLYQHAQQGELNDRLNCQNRDLSLRQDYSTRSFEAEVAKVVGQVDGLKKIGSATTKAEGRAGFNEFIEASQHYLDVTTALQKDRLAHPLGGC